MTMPASAEALPALLEDLAAGRKALPAAAAAELREMLGAQPSVTAPPVRMLHHMACTGGTLISRFMAATPNARLISEVDPLSTISKSGFDPLNLALLYHNARSFPDPRGLVDIFLAGFSVVYDRTRLRGERLILRDHAHSHFCTGSQVPDRPSLRQMLTLHYPLLSALTVRHPLDSYLSVLANKFTHFSPMTLDEYARRYLAFLDAHTGVPIIKYEDFIEDHEATLQTLCTALALPVTPNLGYIAPTITLTGDSGRSGVTLALRDRRPVPDDIEALRNSSADYQALCQRLEYPT